MKLQIAVIGVRRRHLHGHTQRSVVSVTVQVAGPGGGRGGVQLHHKIPQLARVAFEECPTGLPELGVKPPPSGTRRRQAPSKRGVEDGGPHGRLAGENELLVM